MTSKYCKNCRICENSNLIDIIDLQEQIITSRFPKYGDFSTSSNKIVLCLCENCGLIQMRYSTSQSELYEHEYGYRSGISNTMREHLKLYNEEILSIINLNEGDIVIDIGSNDSTFLQYYDKSYKRIGIDPTGKQFKEFYGDVELISDYFTYDTITKTYGDIKCKVISSISMFYDLPNPVQFVKDICSLLDNNGIWTCEQSYLFTMLERNSIDTICHEHLEYYGLTPIKYIADLCDLNIIDIKFNECNGGSFRIYFAKKTSNIYKENTELVNSILQKEEKYGIKNRNTYSNFINNCDNEVSKLNEFIDITNKNGKKMYIYGASTKGNCLLQYANIGENKIKYAVERNLSKVGKMTVTGIEIISEENMRKDPPDFLLVLPWHFRNEIIEREHEYLLNGGQLVFPFPQFEIYSLTPKVLITGCDGMISKYVINEFKKKYNLYGIGHNNPSFSKEITKFYFNMTNNFKLEETLLIIKPDIVVHLAGISSSQQAFNNPIESLNVNGMVTSYLCDIIHRNNLRAKLFNASSSEIYKGHLNYEVTEDDYNMFHCHPYSIAKIMGHSIVDFYRKTYTLPFSNGVLFTIESKHKGDNFLLNKIAKHAKKWKETREVLLLGPLDSYRNLLHASDAAKAISTIIEQPCGDNYIICGEEFVKIYNLVFKLYELQQITIEMKNNILYDTQTNLQVAIIENFNNGLDNTPIKINGQSTKLKNLGFKQTMNTNDILDEL